MRLARIIIVTALIFVLSPIAYSLPDYASYWEFYDSSGNVIGHILFGCYGTSSSGNTSTSNPYSINFEEQCVQDATWECPTNFYLDRNVSQMCVSETACAFDQRFDCIGYPH